MNRASCHVSTLGRFGLTSTLLLSLACSMTADRQTLASLRTVEPDVSEVEIDDGIEQAMIGYRQFLEEAPKSSLTPEAMRRLADLKLEKEYGFLDQRSAPSSADDAPPQPETALLPGPANRARGRAANLPPSDQESKREFEARQASPEQIAFTVDDLELPGQVADPTKGPLEAIRLYDEILAAYPDYPHNDRVLYQKARAFDELGRVDEGVAVAATLIDQYPDSVHVDEIQFRRGEYFFTRKKFLDAEKAYGAIVSRGPESSYYELALYKLGWALYKQFMLEEALDQYIALLDHKVDTGYDFEQDSDEAVAQRVSDTYRVISLCLSELGGADAVQSLFVSKGQREYEDRVYRHLGEFYLEKLRYNDAATVYNTFVGLYPIHRASPHFSMRIVEIYEAGDFPILVLESKKAFAEAYGLASNYWQHFDAAESLEVLDYLKANLEDLANHYHALYQKTERPEDKPEHFAESVLWYRAFLSSFAEDPKAPGIHYRLADLMLENRDYPAAASEYELVAYSYPAHERSASAGYAAIFARREHFDTNAIDAEQNSDELRRGIIGSTLRFVDAFSEHEHAAIVLGAALDDLYALEDYAAAIANGHRLIQDYPNAEQSVRRGAWFVVAHSSFDTDDFENAEQAYQRVLALTPVEDESRSGVTDNLAAAIYKQGERANLAGEYAAASEHFLRVAEAAPDSAIRPTAEYDAAAALIRIEDWMNAARILEAFRDAHPAHELINEVTKQVAFVYRANGDASRAAGEYERVAEEANDPELRREALLVAGELYEEAQLPERALAAFKIYVTEFTHPIEPAVVTLFKMTEIYQSIDDAVNREAGLHKIVKIDREAGDERTDVIRQVAAKSALILSEAHARAFEGIELRQPFDRSLREAQRKMNAAITSFAALVDYEVGEVTAAATYYMAGIYREFGRALLESERPSGLSSAEIQEYEMVLEEEAFTFEEKTIDVHKKNLELMSGGVFNEWIEKSLGELAELMPGRYAKFEASTGLLDSIETYVYRSPRADLVQIVAEAEPDASLVEESEQTIQAIVEDALDVAPESEALPAAPDPSAGQEADSRDIAVEESEANHVDLE